MEHSEKARKINVNRTLFIVLGIALPILSFLIFWLGVNFSSFILAFRRSSTGEWTMDNFAQFWDELTRDGGQIGIAVRNTSIYFAKDLVMLFVNLLLAFFLYKKLFMYKAFRIVFYLPAIISGVVMTTVFAEFIKPQGPLGSIVKSLGGAIPEVGLLGQSSTATITIVIYCIWTGFTGMLMFHGSLARIPVEIIEAARIDGAGKVKQIFYITLPGIAGTVAVLFIMRIGYLMDAGFEQIYAMLTPTAESTGEIIGTYIYKLAIKNGGSYALTTAAGLFNSVVGLILVVGGNLFCKKVFKRSIW